MDGGLARRLTWVTLMLVLLVSVAGCRRRRPPERCYYSATTEAWYCYAGNDAQSPGDRCHYLRDGWYCYTADPDWASAWDDSGGSSDWDDSDWDDSDWDDSDWDDSDDWDDWDDSDDWDDWDDSDDSDDWDDSGGDDWGDSDSGDSGDSGD